MTLHIVVEDKETGEMSEAEIPEGDYLIICHNPCHVAHTAAYGNGTHVLTIKGRKAGL